MCRAAAVKATVAVGRMDWMRYLVWRTKVGMTVEYQQILVERTHEGRVVQVTLNRPEKLNALGWRLFEELIDVTDALADDRSVTVLVLTGSGDKAFCAGADIDDVSDLDGRGFRKFSGQVVEIYRRLRALPQVVVIAANGLGFGGGCALVMAGDMVIAAPHARFAQPEINVGIVGGAALLPRHLNRRARAFEMVLLAERIDAQEAKDLGLVTRIAEEGKLDEAVTEVVAQLLEKPPQVLSMAKEAMVRGEAAADNVSAFALQQDLAAVVFDLPEREAQMNAFLNKGK
ncbi:MAG: hypothetical protein CL569_13095 [Alphaproteobacteria bacterium]|nr:hypothetical protein [Alphaproteobacteria bacterium]